MVNNEEGGRKFAANLLQVIQIDIEDLDNAVNHFEDKPNSLEEKISCIEKKVNKIERSIEEE